MLYFEVRIVNLSFSRKLAVQRLQILNSSSKKDQFQSRLASTTISVTFDLRGANCLFQSGTRCLPTISIIKLHHLKKHKLIFVSHVNSGAALFVD